MKIEKTRTKTPERKIVPSAVSEFKKRNNTAPKTIKQAFSCSVRPSQEIDNTKLENYFQFFLESKKTIFSTLQKELSINKKFRADLLWNGLVESEINKEEFDREKDEFIRESKILKKVKFKILKDEKHIKNQFKKIGFTVLKSKILKEIKKNNIYISLKYNAQEKIIEITPPQIKSFNVQREFFLNFQNFSKDNFDSFSLFFTENSSAKKLGKQIFSEISQCSQKFFNIPLKKNSPFLYSLCEEINASLTGFANAFISNGVRFLEKQKTKILTDKVKGRETISYNQLKNIIKNQKTWYEEEFFQKFPENILNPNFFINLRDNFDEKFREEIEKEESKIQRKEFLKNTKKGLSSIKNNLKKLRKLPHISCDMRFWESEEDVQKKIEEEWKTMNDIFKTQKNKNFYPEKDNAWDENWGNGDIEKINFYNRSVNLLTEKNFLQWLPTKQNFIFFGKEKEFDDESKNKFEKWTRDFHAIWVKILQNKYTELELQKKLSEKNSDKKSKTSVKLWNILETELKKKIENFVYISSSHKKGKQIKISLLDQKFLNTPDTTQIFRAIELLEAYLALVLENTDSDLKKFREAKNRFESLKKRKQKNTSIFFEKFNISSKSIELDEKENQEFKQRNQSLIIKTSENNLMLIFDFSGDAISFKSDGENIQQIHLISSEKTALKNSEIYKSFLKNYKCIGKTVFVENQKKDKEKKMGKENFCLKKLHHFKVYILKKLPKTTVLLDIILADNRLKNIGEVKKSAKTIFQGETAYHQKLKTELIKNFFDSTWKENLIESEKTEPYLISSAQLFWRRKEEKLKHISKPSLKKNKDRYSHVEFHIITEKAVLKNQQYKQRHPENLNELQKDVRYILAFDPGLNNPCAAALWDKKEEKFDIKFSKKITDLGHKLAEKLGEENSKNLQKIKISRVFGKGQKNINEIRKKELQNIVAEIVSYISDKNEIDAKSEKVMIIMGNGKESIDKRVKNNFQRADQAFFDKLAQKLSEMGIVEGVFETKYLTKKEKEENFSGLLKIVNEENSSHICYECNHKQSPKYGEEFIKELEDSKFFEQEFKKNEIIIPQKGWKKKVEKIFSSENLKTIYPKPKWENGKEIEITLQKKWNEIFLVENNKDQEKSEQQRMLKNFYYWFFGGTEITKKGKKGKTWDMHTSLEEFVCTNCGTIENNDMNAAKNIVKFYLLDIKKNLQNSDFAKN